MAPHTLLWLLGLNKQGFGWFLRNHHRYSHSVRRDQTSASSQQMMRVGPLDMRFLNMRFAELDWNQCSSISSLILASPGRAISNGSRWKIVSPLTLNHHFHPCSKIYSAFLSGVHIRVCDECAAQLLITVSLLSFTRWPFPCMAWIGLKLPR